MQSASTARSASNSVTGSLDYIDTLVSGATSQGLYQVVVDGQYINNVMTGSLKTLGYTVEVKYDSMGSFPRYYVKW
jgi:hypothetical protein